MIFATKEKRRFKEKKALTLIEMVVSLAVIMFVSTIFVYNYRDSNKRTDLIMAAQMMVSDIHRAQNNSLGLVNYGEEVPAGGWGVSYDLATPDKYVVFADLEEPGTYGYGLYDSQVEGDINLGAKIVELAPEIRITGIRLGTANLRQSAVVTFLPPDPQINISSGGSTSTTLYVDLTDQRNNNTKTMIVNFLGLAEIIN
ncbi:MAG: hypothetical protein PWQ35_611 [Patescibacteria group bacterium]|nr:hypothetical protein [Patescibacteria group bacterium]